MISCKVSAASVAVGVLIGGRALGCFHNASDVPNYMSFNGDKSLLLFAKWPEAGRVKTRLAADTTPSFAADFYKLCCSSVTAACQRHGPNLQTEQAHSSSVKHPR